MYMYMYMYVCMYVCAKDTYQQDPGNFREALLEAELDEREGADIMMVKPAMPYLDVIKDTTAESRQR